MLRSYSLYKSTFEMEKYINCVWDFKLGSALSKVRLSSHELAIERGVIPDQRLCWINVCVHSVTQRQLNMKNICFYIVLCKMMKGKPLLKYVILNLYLLVTIQQCCIHLWSVLKIMFFYLAQFVKKWFKSWKSPDQVTSLKYCGFCFVIIINNFLQC